MESENAVVGELVAAIRLCHLRARPRLLSTILNASVLAQVLVQSTPSEIIQ